MKKWYLILILITAIFLRFYKIDNLLIFHGELGDNYLVIKNTLGKGIIPLLGPPTSHPWLSFGPLFYYIFGPLLILNHYNPITGAYFWATASILGIFANFFVIKRLFDIKTALISSYLLAISVSWIDLARQSRFFSAVAYLFYPFLFFLVLSLKKPKYLFLLGLVFGIMLNFHLAPIFLLPPVIIIFIPKIKSIKRKDIFMFLLGFIIPNIPFIIYNIKTGFSMLTKFAVWVPYRSILYHNFNLGFTLNMIYSYFSNTIFPPQSIILCFITFIITLISIYKVRKNKIAKILILFLVFGILALILHKDPPSHYFYVLYPIPIIFIALFISKMKSQFLAFAILILISSINMVYLFSDKWFFINENMVTQNQVVPYKLQTQAVKKIIFDAKGRPFNLKRVGFSDQFSQNYAQNYIYLLWLYGNEPKDFKTNLTYTIVEYPNMQIIKTND